MRPAAHGTYGPGQIVAQGNPTQHPGALAGGAPTRAPLSDRAGAAVEDLLRLRCRLSDLVRQFELRLDGPTRDPEPSGGDTADVHIPDGLSERIDMIRHLADRLDQVVDHLNKHVLERL